MPQKEALRVFRTVSKKNRVGQEYDPALSRFIKKENLNILKGLLVFLI